MQDTSTAPLDARPSTWLIVPLVAVVSLGMPIAPALASEAPRSPSLLAQTPSDAERAAQVKDWLIQLEALASQASL